MQLCASPTAIKRTVREGILVYLWSVCILTVSPNLRLSMLRLASQILIASRVIVPNILATFTNSHRKGTVQRRTRMNLLSENIRDMVTRDFSQLTLDIAGHYLLIDIGANLANRKFSKDLDAVLQRARDVGNDNKMLIS